MFSATQRVLEKSPRYVSVRVLDPSPMKSLNRGPLKTADLSSKVHGVRGIDLADNFKVSRIVIVY